MLNFDPFNWYWLAADGRLYSSAAQSYIDADNAEYADWSGEYQATPWSRDAEGNQTEAALQEVLSDYGLFVGLDGMREAVLRDIDAEAERQRRRYITPGSGQAMTYARKVEEAHLLKAASDPQPADYPMLAASVGIDGDTVEEVADLVLAMDAAWLKMGADIEKARLVAKEDAKRAQDAVTMRKALTDIKWP